MTRAYEAHEGSGNVFADLGLADAEELLAKTKVILQIEDAIKAHNLTEATAAERMDMSQTELSDILRGRMDEFSLERLFRCLNALGRDVEITITPKPREHERGEVRVAFRPSRRRGARRAAVPQP